MDLIFKRKNRKPWKSDTKRKWQNYVSIIVTIVVMALLLLLALSMYFPIYYLLTTAFKSMKDYQTMSKFALPTALKWQNFTKIIGKFKYKVWNEGVQTEHNIGEMITYSLIWSSIPPAWSLLGTMLCAYVISKYMFKGRNFLYNLGIVVMIVPIIGSGASGYMLIRNLGIYDNMFLHIIIGFGGFSGMGFMMFYAAFKAIPWEYAEAAFVDGAGHFRVCFQLMIPMVFPTFMALYLLSFLGAWNDYSTFLFTLPSYANLALGLFVIQNNLSMAGAATQTELFAGIAVIAIPTVILCLSTQKIITSKFMVGGLKG